MASALRLTLLYYIVSFAASTDVKKLEERDAEVKELLQRALKESGTPSLSRQSRKIDAKSINDAKRHRFERSLLILLGDSDCADRCKCSGYCCDCNKAVSQMSNCCKLICTPDCDGGVHCTTPCA